jgi:hypothetical protein
LVVPRRSQPSSTRALSSKYNQVEAKIQLGGRVPDMAGAPAAAQAVSCDLDYREY